MAITDVVQEAVEADLNEPDVSNSTLAQNDEIMQDQMVDTDMQLTTESLGSWGVLRGSSFTTKDRLDSNAGAIGKRTN